MKIAINKVDKHDLETSSAKLKEIFTQQRNSL